MTSRILVSMMCAGLLTTGMAGCSTSPTRQQVGIGAGAAVGGALGHVLTDGSTLGTVGGAAVGGVVGNEVAKPRR